MTRVLVDTNILIYATDPTDMYYQISTDILSRGDISLFTTTKNISEFIAVSTKKNIELSKILEYVEYVCTHITVLYPDTKSLDIFLSLVRTYSPR
jgi:predicted nucleic acid-binding protein